MNYPVFLDIEASCYDEAGFPLSLAWSLPDGRIKTVLVMPDEGWTPHATASVDLAHYYDQGASARDIVHEINTDLDGQTLYIDGLDPDEIWLDRLFEACGEEPGFELARIDDLFIGREYATLIDLRQEFVRLHNLDAQTPEHQVLSLLYLFQEIEGIDEDSNRGEASVDTADENLLNRDDEW